MSKFLARTVAALVLLAAGLTISSPVAAQSPGPQVNVTKWSNGRTTLAMLLNPIIDGIFTDDVYTQFGPNTNAHYSAAAAQIDGGVSLTFDTDPPLNTDDWLAFTTGTDEAGSPVWMLVFNIATDPAFDWAKQGSVLLQAHSGDTRLPDPLNRALTATDVTDSSDPAPGTLAALLRRILTDNVWDFTPDSDPLVLNGNGKDGVVGKLLTPKPSDSITTTSTSRVETSSNEDGLPSATITQLPSKEPANIKVPLDEPSTQSGGGFSTRNLAVALLVALGVISLFAWKVRSTVIEKTANPPKRGPDDGDWFKSHPMNPEEAAITKRGCNFVMGMIGRTLTTRPKPYDLTGFDDPPTKPHDSSSDKKDGSGKDDPGDGFVEIEL